MIANFDNDIFLLPREASRAVFQYWPSFSVSCILPATERALILSQNGGTKILNLKTPELVFVQNFWRPHDCFYVEPEEGQENPPPSPPCVCVVCTSRPRFFSSFLFYSVKIENKTLLAKPFRLSNVSESGQVCWGNQKWTYQVNPDNLRHANSIYWQASFNMDLWDVYKKHKDQGSCDLIKHRCATYDIEPVGPKCRIQHRCLNFRVYEQSANEENFCKVAEKHKCHNINFLHEMQIDEIHGVVNICSPELDCLCCVGACNCLRQCKCCTQQCRCARSCDCCLRQCGCKCRCDLKKRFEEYLNKYTAETDPAPWKPANIIWGEKFIATAKHYDAVFVSANPEFLAKVPKEKHRVTFEGEIIVAGFANRTQTGWEITIEEETYNLEEDEVNLCATNGRSKKALEKIEEERKKQAETLKNKYTASYGEITITTGGQTFTLPQPQPVFYDPPMYNYTEWNEPDPIPPFQEPEVAQDNENV